MKKVALIGARGYVGKELLEIFARHDGFTLSLVSSRQLDGQPVEGFDDLYYGAYEPDIAEQAQIDVWVLALPNGLSLPWVQTIRTAGDAVILDLGADWRFDDDWTYGLTEFHRAQITQATLIANPGCYATAAQLALRPILPLLDPAARPQCFGISGYSGAGTTPSARNDEQLLRDNIMPYSLVGHTHEKEISRYCGRAIRFMPHVAGFFRGLQVTLSARTQDGVTRQDLEDAYTVAYGAPWDGAPGTERIVYWSQEIPYVRATARAHHAVVGGLTFSQDTGDLAVVATLDNLLKGAATQAVQNLNLACGYPELRGIFP